MEKYFKEATKIIKKENKINKLKFKNKNKFRKFIEKAFRIGGKDANVNIIDEMHNYSPIPRISKEEMYDLYKTAYMQNPVNILTDENLKILESHCIMTCQYNRGRLKEEHEIVLKLLSKYKEQITELEMKNKIINYMSKEMYLEMPVEFYNNRKIPLQTIEGIKRHFERKVRNEES